MNKNEGKKGSRSQEHKREPGVQLANPAWDESHGTGRPFDVGRARRISWVSGSRTKESKDFSPFEGGRLTHGLGNRFTDSSEGQSSLCPVPRALLPQGLIDTSQKTGCDPAIILISPPLIYSYWVAHKMWVFFSSHLLV